MRTARTLPEWRCWSMSDGYTLHGRLWPGVQKGCSNGFLYFHGVQSHGGWYEWSASVLAGTGRPVLLADRRGSGLNQDARGDTPSAHRWLQDIDESADWLQTEYGAERFGVVGVSWGGKLAALWSVLRPERVAAVLLIAPGLYPAVDIGLSERVKVGLAMLRAPRRTFPLPLQNPRLFTNNPAGQSYIADDPLKLTEVTARFLYFSSRLDRRLARTARAALRAPATLVLAGQDRIIRNPPTERWLRGVAVRPPSVHRLADAGHTIEFEPDTRVFEGILSKWAHEASAAGVVPV